MCIALIFLLNKSWFHATDMIRFPQAKGIPVGNYLNMFNTAKKNPSKLRNNPNMGKKQFQYCPTGNLSYFSF